MTDKRSDIQALRALAVVAVVVGHMNPHWLPGGYLGVDMFFVISGFVITKTLIKEHCQRSGKNTYLWEFWLKRIFRIVPAYFVMMLFVVTAAAIVVLPENFSQFSEGWRKSLVFLSNQYFANYGDYFSPSVSEQPLLHTWSLAVEMQFYLLFPLVIYSIMKLNINGGRGLGVLTLLWIIGAQWHWMHSNESSALYYSLLVRVPEFLLGVVVVFASRKKESQHNDIFPAIGLILIFVALICIDEARFSPASVSVVCVGVALVLYGNASKGVFASIFNARMLLLIGAMSYSIYLWHWPILAFWRYSLGEIHWDLQSIVAYVSIVFVLSWISLRFVEERFRRVPAGRSAVAKSIALFLAMGVVPATYGKALNMSVPSAPVEERRYADGSVICHGQILPTCVRGVKDNPRLLLIGDSHAAQLNIAAEKVGQKLGVGIEVVTASSCVPIDGFDVGKLSMADQSVCKAQIKYVLPKIDGSQTILLAAMWSYQFENPNFEKILHKFLERASEDKKKLIILGQVPKMAVNPQRVNRFSKLGFEVSISQTSDWRLANARLKKILNEFPAVGYYDPSSSNIFFAPPYYASHMIYHDSHHINEIGAAFYSDLLEEAIHSHDWIN